MWCLAGRPLDDRTFVRLTRPAAGSGAFARLAGRAGILSLVVVGTVAFVQVDRSESDVLAANPIPASIEARATLAASRNAERTAILTDQDPGAAAGSSAVAAPTSIEVTVDLDSGSRTVTTSADDVAGLLGELDVVVDAETFLSHELGTTLEPDMIVSARTPETKIKTETEHVDFASEEVEDSNLAKGTRITQTAGQRGETTVTYVVKLVDGVEVDRTPVTTLQVASARDEVVRVGTMNIPDASAKVLSPGEAKALAKSMVAERGMGADQYACLEKLWTRESGWRVKAANSSSGAYGIAQALPGTKMASIAPDWRTNAKTQIIWGLGYVKARYGTPCGAWSAFQAKGWY